MSLLVEISKEHIPITKIHLFRNNAMVTHECVLILKDPQINAIRAANDLGIIDVKIKGLTGYLLRESLFVSPTKTALLGSNTPQVSIIQSGSTPEKASGNADHDVVFFTSNLDVKIVSKKCVKKGAIENSELPEGEKDAIQFIKTRLEELKDRQKAIAAEKEILWGRNSILEVKVENIRSIILSARQNIAEKYWGDGDAQVLTEIINGSLKHIARLTESRVEIEKKLQELDDKSKKLSEKIQKYEKSIQSEPSTNVSFRISIPKSVEKNSEDAVFLPFKLTYRTNDIQSELVYEFNIRGNEELTTDVKYNLIIWNNTKEIWRDVDVFLVTHMFRELSIKKPMPYEMWIEPIGTLESELHLLPDEEDWKSPLTVNTQVFSEQLVLSNVNLTSDPEKPSALELKRFSVNCSIRSEWFASSSIAVYKTLNFINGPNPLLPGRITFGRNGLPFQEGYLEFMVEPFSELNLSLGPDPSFVVSKRIISTENQKRTHIRKYRLRVQDRTPDLSSKKIEVIDILPLSNTHKLRVSVDQITVPPSRTFEGRAEWDVTFGKDSPEWICEYVVTVKE